MEYAFLPTPTPRPESTLAFDFGLETMPSQMAVEAVQGWNSMDQFTVALQISLLIIIVIAGTYLIIRRLRDA